MKIQNLAQLEEIKAQYEEDIQLRIEPDSFIDVKVLGGDNVEYSKASEFVKKIYEYFEKKYKGQVRVLYKNLGFEQYTFDIKIISDKIRANINDAEISNIYEKLDELFKSIGSIDKEAK